MPNPNPTDKVKALNLRVKALFQEKPSEAIRNALAALDTFKATPNCEVDLLEFHEVSAATDIAPEICFACLGGAAALVRLEIPPSEWPDIYCQFDVATIALYDPTKAHTDQQSPAPLSELIGEYENAFDHVRRGEVGPLLRLLQAAPEGQGAEDHQFNRPIYPVDADTPEWRAEINGIVCDLEEAGL